MKRKLFEDGEAGGGPTNVVGTGMIAGTQGDHPSSIMNKKKLLRRRKPLNEDISLVPHLVDSITMIIHTLQSIDTHSLIRHVADALPKDAQTSANIVNELSPEQIKKRKKQFGEVTNVIKDQAVKPLLNKSINSLEMAKKVLMAKQRKFSPTSTELTNAIKKRRRLKKLQKHLKKKRQGTL